MPSGERSKRREREDAIIEVEAAIGEAIPGRGPKLDARMDVARDDKADRSRRRFVVIGGRGIGDVDKPQRGLVERGHAGIEAELTGEPPRRDVVIAEDEHQRRRRHPIAKGPKLGHDLGGAAARGVEEIAENEHPGHVMIAHERLEQRPASRKEKKVRLGRRRGCRINRSPRKAAGGRAPGSGDDGKRRRHAVWFQRSIGAEDMRPTVAVADEPGQRPGTW